MVSMQLFVYPEKIFVKKISEEISLLLKKKPSAVIALPTGSSPLALYKELVKQCIQGKIDFSKAVFMNLDEYAGLSRENKYSYAFFLRKNFLGKINAQEKNIFLFNGAENLQKQAREREALVKRIGIDLALLGIGQNGHIAFNEPGTRFDSKTGIASLKAATRKINSRFFGAGEEVPKKAVTMGLGTILRAKKIILIAKGRKKALAVKKMFERPSLKIPASFLQRHKNALVFCDAEAALLLNKTNKNR